MTEANLCSQTRSISQCIGAALDVERVKRGYRQEQIAQLLSKELNMTVAQGYISQISTGRHPIPIEKLEAYCKVLGVSMCYILEMAYELQALCGSTTLLDMAKREVKSFIHRSVRPPFAGMPPRTRQFRLSSVGPLLRIYRKFLDRSIDEVISNLQRSGAPQWINVTPEGIAEIEEGNLDRTASSTDLRNLIGAYEIPPMMVDDVLSQTTSKAAITQKIEKMTPIPNEEDLPEYGIGTVYCIPEVRLRDPNVAFVLLTLAPREGRSAPHSHPGDEMIICLEGEVECFLGNSGISSRIRPGDYVHFYAEQQHWIKNVSETLTSVFIIRFYQVKDGGTRRRTREAVDRLAAMAGAVVDLPGGKSSRRILNLMRDREVMRYLREITSLPTYSEDPSGEVYDPVGLSRVLWHLQSSKQIKDEYVFAQAKLVGWNRSNADVRRFISGHPVSNANHEDINALAAIFGVPAIILANFMFPSVPGCVRVRQSIDGDLVDIQAAPENLGKVQYKLPCRNLACSDIGITFLTLAPGASSPWNEHPGYELVLPFSGQVLVECPDKGIAETVDSDELEYCHFESGSLHRVLSIGKVDAEMLVIRFLSSEKGIGKSVDRTGLVDTSQLLNPPVHSRALADAIH